MNNPTLDKAFEKLKKEVEEKFADSLRNSEDSHDAVISFLESFIEGYHQSEDKKYLLYKMSGVFDNIQFFDYLELAYSNSKNLEVKSSQQEIKNSIEILVYRHLRNLDVNLNSDTMTDVEIEELNKKVDSILEALKEQSKYDKVAYEAIVEELKSDIRKITPHGRKMVSRYIQGFIFDRFNNDVTTYTLGTLYGDDNIIRLLQ